jgi:hypothetical protein
MPLLSDAAVLASIVEGFDRGLQAISCRIAGRNIAIPKCAFEVCLADERAVGVELSNAMSGTNKANIGGESSQR